MYFLHTVSTHTHTCIRAVGTPLQHLDQSIRRHIPFPIVPTGRAPPALPSGSLLQRVVKPDLDTHTHTHTQKPDKRDGLYPSLLSGFSCLRAFERTFLKETQRSQTSRFCEGGHVHSRSWWSQRFKHLVAVFSRSWPHARHAWRSRC